jgi:beta-aspartyl-peptidase (threonine type)
VKLATMPDTPFSLMIHGGAGAFERLDDASTAERYRASLLCVVAHGRGLLAEGASAVEAVAACVARLEDEPLFNAGRGSVLNELGGVEMDAAIMDGRDLAAGAVASVSNIANPVVLARLVMERSPHVLLVAEGARRFAEQCGVPLKPDAYFRTAERVAELARAQAKPARTCDLDASPQPASDGGTVGAVARDRQGNLAAATSTGGLVNKRVGRVGDSPIIGAGVYADNATCAVSATGCGEDLLRTVIAKTIADAIAFRGDDARAAGAAGIAQLQRRIGGVGGVIVIDRDGHCASGFTTRRMLYAAIERGGESLCGF